MSFHVSGNMTSGELEASLGKIEKKLDAIETSLGHVKTSLASVENILDTWAQAMTDVQEYLRTGRVPDERINEN